MPKYVISLCYILCMKNLYANVTTIMRLAVSIYYCVCFYICKKKYLFE